MNRYGTLVWIALVLSSYGSAQLTESAAPLSKREAQNLARLPLAFEKETNERFIARGEGYLIGIERGSATIGAATNDKNQTVLLEFAGAQSGLMAKAGPELPGKINYIHGSDPKKWRLGLPTYDRVSYSDVYPGIDVVYYGNQQQIEFDLVVKPGADPGAIRMKISGARQISLDSSGGLKADDFQIAVPQIYQEANGARQKVAGHYAIVGSDEVAFQIDAWDHTRPLTIDPTIVYSTLFGGGLNSTSSNAIGLDSMGNMVIAGYTFAADFPTLDAYQSRYEGSKAAFVTKIDAAGSALIYSTYLGGSYDDYATSLAVDSTGAAWLAGNTSSPDFPLLNPAQGAYGTGLSDAFVARLNAFGVLQFSTFLGSALETYGSGIAVDNLNNGYVTGFTSLYDGTFSTTPGVIQSSSGSTFVTKFSPTGAIVYSTLLGGNRTTGQAIAVDSTFNAYVTGYSYDSTFPGMPSGGAQNSNKGNGDAFVAKLNPNATALAYFTFLGGTAYDEGKAIAVDTLGDAYIAGQTSSSGLATGGAAYSSLTGVTNGFAAELNPSGSQFSYVTYLGGNRVDNIQGLALDGSGSVYLAGYTDSTGFPTGSALQSTLQGNGTSLFNTTNSAASWSAYDSNVPGAVFGISVNPSGTSAVVATEGGIYRTINGGLSWTQQFSQQFSSGGAFLARSLAATGTIYAAGCCNSIYQSTDDGITWNSVGSAPGQVLGLVADSFRVSTLYLFGSTAPYIFKSTNGGTTWTAAATGLPGIQVAAMVATSDGSLFAATTCCTGGIYRSTNQASSWTPIDIGIPVAYAFAPGALSASGTTVYFASNGIIYTMTSGGASWTTTPTNVNAALVAASPRNASMLYALTRNNTVFESGDGGTTWNAAETGLPSNIPPSSALLADPSNSASAFIIAAVNEAGVIVKLNNTGSQLTWSTYLGAASPTFINGVTTDGLGDVFVTGTTNAVGFPITSTSLPAATSGAFITEISDTTGSCTEMIEPGSVTTTSSSQNLSFAVTAPTGCAWSASTNQTWAVVTSGASGIGAGIVTVSIPTNTTGATESATLTVGSQNVSITQSATSCDYSLDRGSYGVPSDGGAISAVLTAAAGCPWVVTNNYAGAISITSNASGTGNATIQMTVTPNPGTNTRQFSLSVGASSINVFQPAVSYSQTIAFDEIPNRIFGGSPFVIAAEASSGLPIGLQSTTPAVCATASLLVTLLGQGTCSITASQPGNIFYTAAGSVTRSFTVTQANESSALQQAASSPYTTRTSSPTSVATGDFNEDGQLDLAVAAGNSGVGFLFGNGDGTFNPSIYYPTSNGPAVVAVAVGDFNVDGHLDIAVVYETNDLGILFGNGNGTFNQSIYYQTTIGVNSIAVADFNGDGFADIVLGTASNNNLGILFGSGYGTFNGNIEYPTTTGPATVAVADFNGDGNPDLAIAGSLTNDVTILLGNGHGGFTMPLGSPFPVGTNPSFIAAGDFNGDGFPDLALANKGDNTVTLLLGNGSGSFSESPGSPNAVGTLPQALVVADFNGDGVPDIAVAAYGPGSNEMSILFGKGDGTFNGSIDYPTTTGLASLALGDFNNDGRPDLAVANNLANNITILLGSPGGARSQTITFGSLSNVTFGVAPFQINATSSSGLLVSFVSTTQPVCTVSGHTVTIVEVGVCSIDASQEGSSTYASAPIVTRTFTVNKAAQTVTFGQPGTQIMGTEFALNASSSSGLTVAFASNSKPICTVSGNEVTLIAGGTCSITASQPGDASYAAATPMTKTFTVLKTQTINFAAPSNETLGTGPFALKATATSALAVTFASNSLSYCTVSGATVTLVAAGTCSITASQPGNGIYAAAHPVTQTFTVLEAQTISFTGLNTQTLGSGPVTLSATASSGLTVTFATNTKTTCTVLGANVTLVAAGKCSITASQSGNGVWGAAPPVTQIFTILQAQAITFAAVANQTMGIKPPALKANASSGLPVTFATNTKATCTVSGVIVTLVGSGPCSITASQPGNSTFAAAVPVTNVFSIAP